MATNDMLQYLEPAASGGLASASNRQQVETFLAGGAIAAGDWVMFDTSKTGPDRVLYVIEAPVVGTHGNGACVGVALGAAAADENVRVVVAGYAATASVGGATVINNLLVGPIGTPGMAEPFIAGSTESPPVGFALEADTANVAAVWVFKKF